MKLSSETLAILKNYGNINQGIHFKTGNIIKTISPHKNILTQAEITEEIPCDFGLYDLNNFLSVISLHKDEPELDFDNRHVLIVGNNERSKIKYRFCDPTMIVTPPENDIEMPNPEIKFTLTSEDFQWILRAASVLSSPQIGIESDGDKINIITFDLQNDSAHTDSLEIGDGNSATFRMIFKTESLTKLLPGSYDVSISSKGIAFFVNQSVKIQYYVTIESGSFYNE